LGGHAQIIIGYDDTKEVFTLENSWGKDFGQDGTCEISYEDFRRVSFDWFRLVI
jgi:C1A family cysteine protease